MGESVRRKPVTVERHDMAIDSEGRPLPFTPDQVRAQIASMCTEGEVLAVILKLEDQLGMHVFGQPSLEILETLEAIARAYRIMLRGH